MKSVIPPPPMPRSTPSPAKVETILAEANLLRIRSQWVAAEEKCTHAITLDPKSLNAHSLLGDIYRDQKFFEQAAQWYQLAVDIEPTSASDRAKLEEMDRLITVRALKDAGSPAVNSGNLGTRPIIGLAPAKWFQGFWIVCAIFFVTVLVIVVYRRSRPGAPIVISGTIKGSPGNIPSLPTFDPIASTRQNNANRNSPPRNTASNNNGAGGNRSVEQTPTTSGTQNKSYTAIARSVAGLNATVAAVESATPGRVFVRINQIIGAGANNAEALRYTALKTSITAAKAGFAADQQLQMISVTIMIPDGNTNSVPLFSGQVRRDSAATVAENSDTIHLLAAFQDVSWALPNSPNGQGDSSQPDPP